MKVITVEGGQSLGDALAQAGVELPEQLIDLVGGIMQQADGVCDCPPGTCAAQDDEGGELDVEFEPDFELSDENALSQSDKVEAVSQLGRIIESLSTAVELHAQLIKELVE
ncbi:hypothetical protein [Bradyrhizobium sp. SZCCHNS3053]|uniref:hypothetical protein n=1 Tax=Bradyrhizobium sp. SZCCHNS3053 TaxID=3057322 RepID=UPI0029169B8B|nr:hypothetical protein [Bradyrhizobium sp. SZCCHNS3053]